MDTNLYNNPVYGPVNSKRLGRSLGINLFHPNKKICTFDCVYCELGPGVTTICPKEDDLFSPKRVIESLLKILKKPYSIDTITFSGNGEPTLHPQFPEMISDLLKIKGKFQKEFFIATFSNGSMLRDPCIVRALNKIDKAIIKLDNGDQEKFYQINRPYKNLDLSNLVSTYNFLNKLIIQSIFFKGSFSNSGSQSVIKWCNLLKFLKPDQVQIYTINNTQNYAGLKSLNKEELEIIASFSRTMTSNNIQIFC